MAKRTMQALETSLEDQLASARANFDAARSAAEALANAESDNLATDETYGAWRRRLRVAELELDRLSGLVRDLEAAITTRDAEAKLRRYEARYATAAETSRQIARMMREELPAAWAMISRVIEVAALLEVEVAELERSRPAGFLPKRRIIDPNGEVRCRPALGEEIIDQEIVPLWVDARTGGLFAIQDQRPTKPAKQKQFRQTKYLPAQRGDAVPAFWKELRFPRVGDCGPMLFDGSKLDTAAEVLRALDVRPPTPPVRHPMTRIETITSPTYRPAEDLGPALP